MNLQQTHDTLLERMRSQCQNELREMGHEDLADGAPIVDPDVVLAAAEAAYRKTLKPAIKVKAKAKKSKSQKLARRKNR